MKNPNEVSDKKQEEQEEFYDKLSIEGLEPKELVRHLVKSETEAQEFEFQGQFYPGAFFTLKKLIGSAMKDLSEEEVADVFYYTLKLNDISPFKEKHYPVFLASVEKLLPAFNSGNYYRCHLDHNKLFLLLGIEGEKDIAMMRETPFLEFNLILKFINKAWSFSNYPNMRKKHKSLQEFANSKLLMERVRRSVHLFNEFNHLSAASLILLLMDHEISSKNVLLKYHTTDLPRETVWLLGSFYKDFSQSIDNKELQEDLKNKYPIEWIEEYI